MLVCARALLIRTAHECRKASNLAGVKLDPQVQANFEQQQKSYRKHEGVFDRQPITLPSELVAAVRRVTADQAPTTLEVEAVHLCKYLHARKQPADNLELRLYSNELSQQLQIERGDIRNFPVDQQEKEMEERTKIIKKKLQMNVYHWKPVEYSHFNSLVYLVGRIAPNYATLIRAFTEIKREDPTYQPTTLFDFGSGTGSVLWAAQSMWGHVFKEYFGVDTSDEMNSLSKLLLQGGFKNRPAPIKGLFYRQFLPASDLIKFDLVVSAHSLLELPSIEMRLQTLDNLWRKTNSYLVIIENGTYEGYKTVMEARDFLLPIDKDKETETEKSCDIHVAAPCPHDQKCPLLAGENKNVCCFKASYFPYSFGKAKPVVKEAFSFVILKKGERKSAPWPRIVQPILPRGGHVVCRLCTSAGTLNEYIFSKKKTDRYLYRCSRSSKLGDQLPVNITESNESSTEEQK